MKKSLYKNMFFVLVVGLIAFGGIFFMYSRGNGQSINSPVSSSTSSTAAEKIIDNKYDGYSLSIPEGWYAEENGSDTIVAYPNYSPEASNSVSASSSAPACKIEMSVFAYSSNVAIADWISQRLGADPTVDVKEQSSENISLGNGDATAIKWIGTMDDVPTTIVYAFNTAHAYEIVPIGQCDDNLDLFLQKLTL
jgi:hypothetical protein